MSPEIRRKLDEVCASYACPPGDSARCHLFTCREDGECAFPNLCAVRAAAPSDLSPDNGVSGARGSAGTPIDPHAEARVRFYDAAGRHLPSDELLWREEGRENGWPVPERRSWWRRLWVVRHVGALVLSWRVYTYAGGWAAVGIGIGGPHAQDLWVVEGAYHGYW